MLEGLQYFIHQIKNKKCSAWIHFTINNNRSYITISFHNLALENKIILFCLLYYPIYITQSFNIRFFQPFKYYYIDIINQVIWLENEKFGKIEFLAVFQLFRNQTFKQTNILYVLKLNSLVVFNSNVVFDKICKKQVQKIETALQTHSSPPFSLHQYIF